MSKPIPEPQDVVLYGFGRIGRLLARLLIEKTGSGDMLRLRAIVVRKGSSENDLCKRASLLRRDSVHGAFEGTIRVLEDKNILVCNGNPIQVIYANSPRDVDYQKFGIDNAILIDNTGAWRDEDGLSLHCSAQGPPKLYLPPLEKGRSQILFMASTIMKSHKNQKLYQQPLVRLIVLHLLQTF